MEAFFNHPHWKIVQKIYRSLKDQGKISYLAGGCVRDALLGISPQDFDFATSARPEEVEALFPRTIAVGKKFGTIVVVEEGYNFEITSFRADLSYKDGRHPEAITYGSEKQDALRRDFSINSIFYDLDRAKIIDYNNGKKDLTDSRIHFVGDGDLRVKEDHLRLLRALRFSAQLDFSLSQDCIKAINKNKNLAFKVSKERVVAELLKLNRAQKPLLFWDHLESFTLMDTLLGTVASEYRTVRKKMDFLLAYIRADKFLSWFFACFSEKLDKDFLLYLKFSKAFAQEVEEKRVFLKALVRIDLSLSELLRLFSKDFLLEIEINSIFCKKNYLSKEVYSDYLRLNLKAFQKYKLPIPLVDGQDLINLGLKPGPQFRKILNLAFESQLNEQTVDKDKLLEFVKSQIES